MAAVVAELWKKDGTKTTHRFPTREEYDAYPQYAIVRDGVPCLWAKAQAVPPLDMSVQEPAPAEHQPRQSSKGKRNAGHGKG